MPCKCILYPLPQIVFLSACNRVHALTGSGRLLSVFILASRELTSIWDLSSMESRSTGMESPTPAEHQANMALHREAKLCSSPGQRVQIGQLLGCSPFPRARQGCRAVHCSTYPMRASAGVFSCPSFPVHPALVVQIRLWANPPSCCTHPTLSLHAPSFTARMLCCNKCCFSQIAVNCHGTRCERLGLCGLFINDDEFEKQNTKVE